MRIDYQGQREDDKNRFALLSNVKHHELDIIDKHLIKEERKFDAFGNGGEYDYFILVEDKEDFEDFKDYEYKKIKEHLKK